MLINSKTFEALKDPEFVSLATEEMVKSGSVKRNEAMSFRNLMMHGDHPVYYITNSAMKICSMLKPSRIDKNTIDYQLLSDHLPSQKFSMILVDGSVIRVIKAKDRMGRGIVYAIRSRIDNEKCFFSFVFRFTNNDHYSERNLPSDEHTNELDEILFKCLTLIFMMDPQEVILQPGKSIPGTRETKVINKTKSNVIVVDKNWVYTSIRNEGFDVRGHLAIRRCGVGRKDSKVVLIEPFRKNGYKRKSKTANA